MDGIPNGAGARAKPLAIGELHGAAAVRDRRTTQELVFEFLRDAILSGRLRGGTHLVQDALATQLRVSRVPVREALLQLEALGLVRMEAHRGASVVWLSPEEVQEIFDIRKILVTASTRLVVPTLSDEQIARLRKIAQQQSREANMATRARLNHTFYAALFERLDRPRLLAMMDKLEREVERFLTPLDRPHLGHQALVEACEQRDADRAAELVGDHLDQLRARAVASLHALLAEGARPPAQPRPRRRRSSVAAQLLAATHLADD